MKMLSTAQDQLASSIFEVSSITITHEFMFFSDLLDWRVCLPLLLEVGQSLQTGFGDNLVGFMSYISPKLNCLISSGWKKLEKCKDLCT